MKTIARIGKIARLPHPIREQLNLKLHDNIPAKSILPWLNSLPEVKAVLAADFDNHPITKQNLSDWKQGGHRDWLLQYHAAHFLQSLPSSSSSSSIPSESSEHPLIHGTQGTADIPSLSYKLLLWTQLQYISMARHIDSETNPKRKWNALRQFSNDISRLRRSSLADDYLQIQRDWLALSQSNSTEKKQLEFCKWIKRPDIAEALNNKKRGLTKEMLRKIEEEDLYLLGPDDSSLDEHIAQVQLAKELMARRKAKEAEANRQPGDPAPEPPRINLRDTTFEELFPTIPDKPLTETHPELDDREPDDAQSDKPRTAPVSQTSRRNVNSAVAADSPHAATTPATPKPDNDDFPLHKGEGQGEEAVSSAVSAPENYPSVQPSPGESSPVQPNPTTPPPGPESGSQTDHGPLTTDP